ncbi:ATP-dependent DNA ligase [Sinomonas sp. ASV322]|uniref:ATP-dependent DNA ligase n=1 Tax=Sinomonas sp. ASV322 TaxID=3041920 RepID=UPI0027DACFF1|nr:ATP-dependent DNA ligase [Sinomonas sp. ASV322]MDQ4504421.1 ATP-dependent DNA ligase [Sinomonas sp. ASV322]
MTAGRAEALGGAFDLALARAIPAIPDAPGLQFEPKWDGVRAAVVIADGRTRIFSRNGADLTASFPELEQAAVAQIPDSTVVDGEIVSWGDGRLDFDAVLHRLSAGPLLARRLAAAHPVNFVAFDVLAVLGRDVRQLRMSDRRRLLEGLAAGFAPPMQISPATLDRELALQWWDELACTGVEGIVSKADQPYRTGRSWLKTKKYTPSDAVAAAVLGPRPRPRQLVLGLYDGTGRLRVAGRTGPLTAAQAAAIAPFLHTPVGGHPWPEVVPPGWFGRFARDTGPVHLTLVTPLAVEVSADAARTGTAYRHLVRFIRPRPDTDPVTLRTG